MKTPTEYEINQLMHLYDPVKAHEYYIKNRKLKGRKAAAREPIGSKRSTTKKDLSKDRKFLESLPLAQEGMPLAKVSQVVKSFQSKNDSQLKSEIARLKAIDAQSANPSPLGGLEAMTAERVLKARRASGSDPRTGKTREQISKDARTRQRKELTEGIRNLEDRLKKLEALIRTRQQEEAAENRKAKAKKERAAKEKDKPKSAAEKAKIARENKKYREKNQQKLKSDAKKRDGSSGGGSSSKTNKDSKSGPSVSDLKTLATRVRGQIAVAKQKLAAL